MEAVREILLEAQGSGSALSSEQPVSHNVAASNAQGAYMIVFILDSIKYSICLVTDHWCLIGYALIYLFLFSFQFPNSTEWPPRPIPIERLHVQYLPAALLQRVSTPGSPHSPGSAPDRKSTRLNSSH